MANFEKWLNQDLQSPVEPVYIQGFVFTGDNDSNKIGVHVTDGGFPAALSGSVVAHVIRSADGGTVTFSGTLSGNDASAILPAACFAYKGQIAVMLQLVTGTTKTTLCKAIFGVTEGETGTPIDPGDVVPNIDDLLAMLDQMEQATDAANAAAAAVPGLIAPTFSSSAAYAAGDYVYYDGDLYRFTAAHAAGAWSGTDAVEVQLGPEVSDLKSALNDKTLFTDQVFEAGSVAYNPVYTNNAMNSITGEQSNTSPKRASTPGLYYLPDYCYLMAIYNNTYRPTVFFFNDNKTYIGYSDVRKTGQVSVPSGAKYMRFFVFRADDTDISTTEAAEAVTYTCEYHGRVNEIDDTVDVLETKVNKCLANNNLLVGHSITNGYYDAYHHDNSTYKYFSQIPVEANKTYTIYPRARMVYIYDASDTLVNYLNEANITSITAEGNGYAYVTYYATDNLDSASFYEANAQYVYGREYYALTDNVIQNGTLQGKKWAVLGDSFTAGADSGTIQSGTYAGQNIVYPYLIGNRTGIEVLRYFAGGRTLAYPATPGDFVNSVTCPGQSYYYQNIPADVDYITIYLGINDSHHAPNSSGSDGEDTTGEIPIGTITDSTTATYYGAWNVVLTWLKTNRPFAHIGIIVSNGCDTDDYRTAQIAIAKKYGIPYIDLNGDERTPAMIRSRNPDVADAVKTILLQTQSVDYAGGNLHPNNNAHEFESHIIEAFLKSL